MNNKDSLIWLNSINGVGYKTIEKLVEFFGSLEDIWEASKKEIYNVKEVNIKILEKIVECMDIKYLEEYKKKLSFLDVQCIIGDDDLYPLSLKNINTSPYLLYAKGDFSIDYSNSIAIVGSRKATSYGKNIAYKFARELASNGITVISGMAYGIDSAAHKGAIDAGGKTVAVLGCGIDICYPKTNHGLMKDILKNGGLITEYALGIPPHPGNFPQRNRIISGLSKCVLVVEASLNSGSLITVDYALEQGKDVYTIPGNILSNTSEGTNKLIKEGAKVITCVEDILEEFNIQKKSFVNNKLDLSYKENEVLDIIVKKQPIHVDLIAAILNMNSSELNSIITILEIKGIIEQLPGKIIITK